MLTKLFCKLARWADRYGLAKHSWPYLVSYDPRDYSTVTIRTPVGVKFYDVVEIDEDE